MAAVPTPHQLRLIQRARNAHLATADGAAAPHLVPICFAYDGESFYSVIDQKPKRPTGRPLKRVRNIISNPQVALLLDHYEEDWRRLWYLLVLGGARLLERGDDQAAAVVLLRDKYPQYRKMDLDDGPVIKITPSRLVDWSSGGEGTQP